MKKNIQNANVSFNVVTLAIYSNNNGNMVVGEITEFFQFQNVTSPPHAVGIPFMSSYIKVSISYYKIIEIVRAL